MSSGADLFVICKQCGAEVSPYITECPYCGSRLRKRAPKLPRDRLRRSLSRSRRPFSAFRVRRARAVAFPLGPPLVTALLVAAPLVLWVVTEGGGLRVGDLLVRGPLQGDWWRLFTYQFAYAGSSFPTFLYGACVLTAIAVFGAALEHRHGAAVVTALFIGSGVAGALAALALYPLPLLSGGEGGSVALLVAWLVPELEELRRGRTEGDVVGALAFAFVLAVLPFAVEGASWTAAVVGGLCGALSGSGLAAARSRV
jgi:membrane associated rhomboid family serine protease/ribosomal protein L40E